MRFPDAGLVASASLASLFLYYRRKNVGELDDSR